MSLRSRLYRRGSSPFPRRISFRKRLDERSVGRSKTSPSERKCGRHRPSQSPEWILEHQGSDDTHRRREEYMSGTLRTVGIDISKDWLDSFAAPEGRASRFSNDKTGFRKLIAWIGSKGDRIAYEPSGPFHRDLEETLLKTGLPCTRSTPSRSGPATTPSGGSPRPMPWTPGCWPRWQRPSRTCAPTEARSEGLRDLAERQQIRDGLCKGRNATINRGNHLRTPVGKRLNKQRLRQVKRQLEIIDAAIRQRLEEEKALERRAEILTCILGISDVTAAGTDRPLAGVAHPHRCPSCQPLRADPCHPGVWILEGTRLHPWRQAPGAQAAIHARDGRRPPLSRPQAELRSARGPREAAEGRPDSRDAETPHPLQRPGAAGPHLDDASAGRILLPGLPDAQPGRERSRMIKPGQSQHRRRSVERNVARQVASRKSSIHLTWIRPPRPHPSERHRRSCGRGKTATRAATSGAPARAHAPRCRCARAVRTCTVEKDSQSPTDRPPIGTAGVTIYINEPGEASALRHSTTTNRGRSGGSG